MPEPDVGREMEMAQTAERRLQQRRGELEHRAERLTVQNEFLQREVAALKADIARRDKAAEAPKPAAKKAGK